MCDSLEYNHKILSQERKRQKISQENAATQITLSLVQIKSLENNLNTGFITSHFKSLALKRYAIFLGIDLDKILPPPETHQEINKVSSDSKIGYEDIDLSAPEKEQKNSSLLQKLNLKIKKISIIKVLILLLLLGLIFFFTQTDYADLKIINPNSTNSNINSSKEKNVLNNIKDIGPISKAFIKNEEIKTIVKENIQEIEIENESDIIPIEFLCSIKSASMDNIWSRINPEKPPTYFHIVSLKKQTICTVDNQGNFKQYNLAKGGKITHRGEAPFKIQLNPSISELYFQGWKVILKGNDNFIQLNPVEMPTELN